MAPGSEDARTGHLASRWDDAYASKGPTGVSWFESSPEVSLELIDLLGVDPDDAVIDVGGGASYLVDRLLDRGHSDVTVLDVSEQALAVVRARLAPESPVTFLCEDVLAWRPERRYSLWHDRAALHFFLDESDRARYVETLQLALAPGGGVVVATFAPDAPERCSGLPVARYSPDEIAALLGPDFELVHARRAVHVTPRGAVQPFTWVAGRLGRAEGGRRGATTIAP